MTYEEALETKLRMCDICRNEAKPTKAACENCSDKVAIESIGKQIPKKPAEYTLHTESDEEVHYEGCPSCRAILNKSHYFLKICHCGQKLEV